MYFRIILLLALISSVHLLSLDKTQLQKAGLPEKCTPFSTVKVDCNTCMCGATGVIVGCTKMACHGFSEECVPNTVFKDDCNTCVCGANGVARCTLMACPTDPHKCTPNTVFQIDCNTCICTPNGLAACTLKLCPDANKADLVGGKSKNAI